MQDDTQPETSEDEKILNTAKSLYQIDKEHWDPIFEKGRDDLDFLSDEDDAQWPEREYNQRFKTGRPVLTVDQLTQFCHQVENNIRMNTPSINPIPAGGGSSVVKAKVIKGLIKKIEYVSCADEVYDTGAKFAIRCSIGFAFIDHDYVDDDSFNQQLLIKRCINPFVVYMDSATMESDGRDQNHCTVLEKMRVKAFRAENPEAEVSSFDETVEGRVYSDEEEITIANFFIKDTEEKIYEAENNRGEKVTRTTKKVTINRYRMSGTQILKRSTFPGEYIPVVPFYGEEAWIDGKRNLYSLIRKSKQAQYMYNLMASIETEVLLKQPIAPVMVPAGAIENYKEDWKDPSKAAALRYDQFDKDGNQLQAPSRLMPPQIPAGVVNARRESVDDIKATMGLYNSQLGQQGAEVSGKAINARKIQGDVATYHFGDNAVRSITQIGRIVVCAIPSIYDMEREIGIIDDEDKPKQMGINGLKLEEQEESHDLTDGKYDVRVITGSSFTTMRQESAEFYQEVVKSSPELMKVCGDLLFENMDIAGAQKMAARMKKLIDPKLIEGEDGGKEQDPQVLALQQELQQAQQLIQAGAQELQSLQQQLQDKTAAAQMKFQTDQEKNQLNFMQLQLKKQQQQFDQLLQMLNLQLDTEKQETNEQNVAGNLALKAQGQDFDQFMAQAQLLERAMQPQALPGEGNPAANNGAGNDGVNNNG